MSELSDVFGPFKILKVLGEGGMGAVYLAHDTRHNRTVALKVPQWKNFGDRSARENLRRRFLREAEATSAVSHRNICPVYDYGEVDGQAYLAMKYVAGQPLDKKLASGKLSVKEAVAITRKIALGMKAVHKTKIVHRDLKPQNILVDEEGEPVVVDFGLARATDGSASAITQSHAFLGTPMYAPPEQFGDAKHVGAAADIYSLGAILYEMLTGRPPFVAGTLPQLLQKILTEAPARPSSVRSDLDRSLDAICLKALAKRPDARYSTMHRFAADLSAFLRGDAPAAVAGRFDWQQPNVLIGGGIAAAVVVLTLGIALIVANGRRSTNETPPIADTPAPTAPIDGNGPVHVPAPVLAPAVDIAAKPVVEWSMEEFQTALRDGPPPGVELRPGDPQQFPATEGGAAALGRLLEAIVAQGDQDPLRFSRSETLPGGMESAVTKPVALKTVIEGLAINETPPARDTLRKLAADGYFIPGTKTNVITDDLAFLATSALLRQPPDEWTIADLRLSCRWRYGGAAKAIESLKFQSPEIAVRELTQLLDVLQLAPPGSPGSLPALTPGSGADFRTAVMGFPGSPAPEDRTFDLDRTLYAVLVRLSETRTEDAARVLQSIVNGKRNLSTQQPEVGVQQTLALYLDWDDDAQAREFLRQNFFAAARQPDQPANGAILDVFRQFAGARLIADIVRHLKEATPAIRDQALAMIAAFDPDLVEAQVAFYVSGFATAEQKQILAGWFLRDLERASARQLGRLPDQSDSVQIIEVLSGVNLPSGFGSTRRRSGNARGFGGFGAPEYPMLIDTPVVDEAQLEERMTAELAARVFAALANEDFIRAVQTRFDAPNAQRKELLRLLACIPAPAARRTVRQIIHRTENAGPAAVFQTPNSSDEFNFDETSLYALGGVAPMAAPNMAKSFGIHWLDPAGVFALKSTERLRMPASSSKKPRRSAQGFQNVAPRKPSPPTPVDIKRDWFAASEEFVVKLANRLLQTSHAPDVPRQKMSVLPWGLELPENAEARIVVNFTLDWPAGPSDEQAGDAALRIHFAQVLYPKQSRHLQRGLEKQLESRKIHGDDDWIDITAEQEGRIESFDVLFSDLATESQALFLLIQGSPSACGIVAEE